MPTGDVRKIKSVPLRAKQAQRRGADVALPVFILGGWSAPPAALPQGKGPNTLCTEDWVDLVGRYG